METNTKSWEVGEMVVLPRTTRQVKSSSFKSYERIIGSRYICIREATEGHYGILLKVLGRTPADFVKIVSGAPFCKDDSMELFEGVCYFSYPFPALSDLKEVIDILSDNPSLLQKFEEASMHVNPKATFWVREIAKSFLMTKPQFYDVSTDRLSTATIDPAPYRLSIVYFTQDKSISVR